MAYNTPNVVVGLMFHVTHETLINSSNLELTDWRQQASSIGSQLSLLFAKAKLHCEEIALQQQQYRVYIRHMAFFHHIIKKLDKMLQRQHWAYNCSAFN